MAVTPPVYRAVFMHVHNLNIVFKMTKSYTTYLLLRYAVVFDEHETSMYKRLVQLTDHTIAFRYISY